MATTILESISTSIGRSDRWITKDNPSIHAHNSGSKASLHENKDLQAEKIIMSALSRKIIPAPAPSSNKKAPLVFPTVRNFAWRLAVDSLPTWKNMHKIGLEQHGTCPVCGMEEEDNFHPFIRCQFGHDLYVSMAAIWRIPVLESIENVGKEWVLHVLEPLNDVQRSMLLLIF